MIRLGGLVSQKAFGKFEMGKVISNPFANAFIKEGEGEDHEVSMANNSIDIIIKMATELKAKMGEDEKQIPAWIQDHIAKAENLISQASGNYHEYGDSNESVNETVSDKKVDAKVIANKMRKNQSTKAFANKVEKMGKVSHKDLEKILPDYVSGALITNLFKESVNEGVSSADMDKIKGAVEAAKSFMNVGAELKKLGMKYTFATEPLAIYIIQPTPNNKVAIVNKKYVSKPDFVVGDIAVGVMEGNSIKEDKGPCWQGYKQVGMKDKGGKQVPNCVPNK